MNNPTYKYNTNSNKDQKEWIEPKKPEKFSTQVKLAMGCLGIVCGINFVAVGYASIKPEVAMPNFLFGFGIIAVSLAVLIVTFIKVFKK
jgi:hypothetical protein